MRVAEDPIYHDEVDVDLFIQRNRRNTLEHKYDKPTALCPACLARVKIVAELSKRTTHFRHVESNLPCPIVDNGKRQFVNLPPGNQDPAIGLALKASFHKNWKIHHNILESLIAALSISEFQELLKAADERRIWDLRGIEECHIPYIMLTLLDFPPRTGQKRRPHNIPKRHFWISFYFRQTQQANELWIREPRTVELVRLLFECSPAARVRPDARQLRHFQRPPYDLDFLRTGDDEVEVWIDRQMTAWFREHWKK